MNKTMICLALGLLLVVPVTAAGGTDVEHVVHYERVGVEHVVYGENLDAEVEIENAELEELTAELGTRGLRLPTVMFCCAAKCLFSYCKACCGGPTAVCACTLTGAICGCA